MEYLDVKAIEDELANQFSVQDAFRRNIDQFCDFDKNMGENKEEILKILIEDCESENKHYNFIAGMNSGKTYTLLDIAVKKKLKMVIAVPLKMIMEQKTDEYKKKNPGTFIGVIRGRDESWEGTNDIEIEVWIKDSVNIFICVYDSLNKLLNNSFFKPEEYILVIDEAHDLVTQFDFRYKAIKYLTRSQEQFKKIIYLSGTPEGILPHDYKTILFQNSSEIKKDNFDFYLIKYVNNGFWKLFNLIINAGDGGKLVLIDNIALLKQLKKALINYGISEKRIAILHGNDKNSKSYNDLITTQKILEYTLTTRVIADGANIYGKLDSIYMLNIHDFWLKRQFVSRCREEVRVIYDLISYKSERPETWPKINDYYLLQEKLYQEQNNLLNQKVEFEANNKNFSPLKIYYDERACMQHSYWDKENGKFILSKESIRYRIIKELNSKMANNIEMAIDYYQ